MRLSIFFGIALTVAASTAIAQDRIAYSRAIFVEQATRAGVRAIEPATRLRRGDRVVLVVEWAGQRSDSGRYLMSAIPADLSFQKVSRDGVQISVDGGRNWGMLGKLRITDQDGRRLASPEDVTHLRWRTVRGKRGRLTYSAIVR